MNFGLELLHVFNSMEKMEMFFEFSLNLSIKVYTIL